ncbi:MAG TPA: hypothetical protein VGF14_03235 [Alphaproteobacteria bacterium]
MDDTKNEAPVKQMTAQEQAAADYIGAILEMSDDPRAAEVKYTQGIKGDTYKPGR